MCRALYGLGLPQLEQNLPLLTFPQLQVHSPLGLGCPQLEQNLPVFTFPQEQVQLPAAGAEAGCAG